MKNRCRISVWLVSMMLLMVGCGEGLPAGSSASLATNRGQTAETEQYRVPTDSDGRPSYSPEVIEKDFADFQVKLHSLNESNVTKVAISYRVGMSAIECESSDPHDIKQWIDLLQHMRFTPYAGVPISGASTGIYFTVNGEEISLGLYITPDVCITKATWAKIDNYDEIEKAFVDLRQDFIANHMTNSTVY